MRDIICDNNWSKVSAQMKNCNIVVVKVTYAQPFVFKMESMENPLQPCEVDKRNLDFDAVVQEINERQEEIKKHLRENDKIDHENEETKPDRPSPYTREMKLKI